jgi:hypothetical protein
MFILNIFYIISTTKHRFIKMSKNIQAKLRQIHPSLLRRNRMPQKLVNWMPNCTIKYVRNFFIASWLHTNFFEMRSSVFSAQLTKLRYHFTNWLAGLNLNITVNMRGRFKLTDFGPFCTLVFFLFCWTDVSECTLAYMMVLWNISRMWWLFICLLSLFTDVCGYSVVMSEQFFPLNLGISPGNQNSVRTSTVLNSLDFCSRYVWPENCKHKQKKVGGRILWDIWQKMMSHWYMLKKLKYKVIVELLQEIVSVMVYSQINFMSFTDELNLFWVIFISLLAVYFVIEGYTREMFLK